MGVLFVGAGPAGLAGAIRLAQLLEEAPGLKDRLGEVPVAVVEKGKYPGAHLVSGAVIVPSAFRKLFPSLPEADLPFRAPVTGESLYLLTRRSAVRSPLTPPTMRNRGNFTASISEVGRWLGERAEALGVMILSETAAMQVLLRDGAVCGIRTGDKGRGRDGTPLSNFEPGSEILARATVLAEGAPGHLASTVIERFGLGRRNPQTYALGVKEVWEVPRPPERVIHTMGWPLRWGKKYGEFGGSFIYPMGEHQVSIGLVVGLDSADASVSTHDLLQELKTHPFIERILDGGSRHEKGWGAKTIPEGGFYSLPGKLHVPGALLVGDSAGFVNVPSLKGIHYAMWSGILAAETIFETLKAGRAPATPGALAGYDEAVRRSFIWRELHRVRNMRAAFSHGFVPGALLAGVMTASRGLFPGWRFRTEPDAARPVSLGARAYPRPDGRLTFDKLSSVYASGNRTRDSQPNHLRVSARVSEAVGEAWIHMCPAAVYEWAEGAEVAAGEPQGQGAPGATGPAGAAGGAGAATADEVGRRLLRINAPNCVQCGAISAKGGRLTPPEGGSGPEYTVT